MEKMVSGLKSQNGLLEAEEDDLNRMIQEQSQQMIEDDHKEKVALFSFNLLVELLGEGQQSGRAWAQAPQLQAHQGASPPAGSTRRPRTVQQLRPCRVLETILIPAEGFPSSQTRPKKEL
ncbi:unnamed protein product [Boreogadus saida]